MNCFSMMNCTDAAKASTYVHKHAKAHPLNSNAYLPELQTIWRLIRVP